MKKLIKLKSKLNKFKIEEHNVNRDIEDLECEIEELNDKNIELEGHRNSIEWSIENLIKTIKEHTRYNLNCEKGSFEEKVIKSTLFTGDDLYNEYLKYVYIDNEYIYAMDGYRAIKYRHENKDIDTDCELFIDIENLKGNKIDINSIEKFEKTQKLSVIEIVNKVISEAKNNENIKEITNINKDILFNDFDYTIIDSEKYSKLNIFKFGDMKIAINKDFVDDAMSIIDGNFNIKYSTNVSPIIFYNGDFEILILPIRYSKIDEI